MNHKVILPILLLTALFVLSCCTSKKSDTITNKAETFTPLCTSSSKEPCWKKIEGRKDCYFYNTNPKKEETVTWDGDCSQQVPNGKGNLIWNWKESRLHKIHKIGTYKNGKLEGYGKKYWYLNNVVFYEYIGEFYNNLEEGSGILKIYFKGKLAITISGNFKKENPSGKMMVKYEDGQLYRGEMRGWDKEGWGEQTDNDGFKYIGNFKNNLFSGEGKAFYPNKNIYDGEWKKGEWNGEGLFTTPTGERLVGIYEKGKPLDVKAFCVDGREARFKFIEKSNDYDKTIIFYCGKKDNSLKSGGEKI